MPPSAGPHRARHVPRIRPAWVAFYLISGLDHDGLCESHLTREEVSHMARLAERLGCLWQRYMVWRQPRPWLASSSSAECINVDDREMAVATSPHDTTR